MRWPNYKLRDTDIIVIEVNDEGTELELELPFASYVTNKDKNNSNVTRTKLVRITCVKKG